VAVGGTTVVTGGATTGGTTGVTAGVTAGATGTTAGTTGATAGGAITVVCEKPLFTINEQTIIHDIKNIRAILALFLITYSPLKI
jgi:hypothetical protein